MRKILTFLALVVAGYLLAEGLRFAVAHAAESDETGETQLVERHAGTDRIATAIAISEDGFADQGAWTAVLTNASGYADALAGTPLAVDRHGPLLLNPSDMLDARVATELLRVLSAGSTVYLLGGEAALGSQVEDEVRALGFEPLRLAGPSRYETAAVIAAALPSPAFVLVATGTAYPDALAAGAAAGAGGGVVLLSDGMLPHPATDDFLDGLEGLPTYAVGGPAAQAYPEAGRIAGADRYETARLVAEALFTDPDTFGLASGEGFADALAGGAHIAGLGGPLLLTPPHLVPQGVQDYLELHGPSDGHVYGGPNAVSDEALAQAQGAASGNGSGGSTAGSGGTGSGSAEGGSTDPAQRDSDGDGLTDAREAELGTNPVVADTDGDGLTDGEEVNTHMTDPRYEDTDHDGLSDGDEVKIYRTFPRFPDTDSDGLPDGDEVYRHGTDPRYADSDRDGYNDGVEINEHHTDPLVADSDGDGLLDGEEHDRGTSPWHPDTDGDGLNDRDEVLRGTDPRNADTDGDRLKDGEEVNAYGSDPKKKDTDGDGLDDGNEVQGYNSNPLDPDTDDDGLSDGDEANTWVTDPTNSDSDNDSLTDAEEVLEFGTNPNNADSDGGGANDGTEVARGTNPKNASDDGGSVF